MVDDRRYWMYVKNHTSNEYLEGLDSFRAAAEEDMRNKDNMSMLCPCAYYKNGKQFTIKWIVQGH